MTAAIEDGVTALLVERAGQPGTTGMLVELYDLGSAAPAHEDSGGSSPQPPGMATSLLPGLPTAMRYQLGLLSSVLAGDDTRVFPGRSDVIRDPGTALIAAATAALMLSRWLDGTLVRLARSLAERAGTELLVRKGEVDPEALSRTSRERWRQQTKSVVANELQALTGRGIQECHDLVGFALAPPVATTAALTAMEEGRADWARTLRWWRRCRRMSVEDAARVAHVVFAAGGAATEREHDGSISNATSMAEFTRVLDREAARVEGRDTAAARQRRREAVEARTAYATFGDDGTACLSVTGRTSTVAAAIDRIDSIARKARAAGDTRPLDQLRSDAALALLTYGTIPGPERSAPAGVPRLVSDPDADTSACGAGDELLHPAAGGGWDAVQVERLGAVLEGHAPASVEVIVPLDVLTGADPDGIGEIVGHGFITGEHARELVCVPGSTLYRLVTDPVSGVALDRSIDRYTPDEQMRRMVTALDRMCRGPGCTKPARSCDLDHVQEYPEGSTSVTNLAPEDDRHHGIKTNKWWRAVMQPGRRMRWTTLFGCVYTTSPHDYRQYSGRLGDYSERPGDYSERPGDYSERPGGAGGLPTGSGGLGELATLDADRRDQLLYAALAHRETVNYLSDYDDDAADEEPGPTSRTFRDRSVPVMLRHRTPGGAVRRGAPPGQPDPGQMLAGAAAGQDRAGRDTARDADDASGRDDEPPPF